MARERERWRVCQCYMDGERFIFLDETGASTNITRLYGWGERGERLIADSDRSGRAFRSEAGHCSDVKPATIPL